MNAAEETPARTEAQFMQQVTELAEIRGWQWAHFRPAMTTKGWRTPVSGPLGAGWPDLVLVRPYGAGPDDDGTMRWTGRLIFVELKAARGKLTDTQRDVLDTLSGVPAPVEVHTWTPNDWDAVEETLR